MSEVDYRGAGAGERERGGSGWGGDHSIANLTIVVRRVCHVGVRLSHCCCFAFLGRCGARDLGFTGTEETASGRGCELAELGAGAGAGAY